MTRLVGVGKLIHTSEGHEIPIIDRPESSINLQVVPSPGPGCSPGCFSGDDQASSCARYHDGLLERGQIKAGTGRLPRYCSSGYCNHRSDWTLGSRRKILSLALLGYRSSCGWRFVTTTRICFGRGLCGS